MFLQKWENISKKKKRKITSTCDQSQVQFNSDKNATQLVNFISLLNIPQVDGLSWHNFSPRIFHRIENSGMQYRCVEPSARFPGGICSKKISCPQNTWHAALSTETRGWKQRWYFFDIPPSYSLVKWNSMLPYAIGDRDVWNTRKRRENFLREFMARKTASLDSVSEFYCSARNKTCVFQAL